MTARTTPGRRALLAGAAIAPAAALASGATAAPVASAMDERLVMLAAHLRDAEAYYNALVGLEDAKGNDPAEKAASLRIMALVGAMADIPAEGLLGIAAKAGRLCWSLQPQHGGALMYCEDALAESLAADLARLAPQALGVQA
ncbi:MAG: hypothetical protein EON48_07790 [Acetobacteraceae bacterium]|nr:MAG: hypothetical protein EON48_07790 [Acetobacteraceae bacterium]